MGEIRRKGSGAAILEEDVLHLEPAVGGRFRVKLESGESILTWTLVLAMGISRNRLNVPGEKELLGKGVSYCVDCDANFFRNQVVTVIGNGSAAASGALKLLLIAGETHLVCGSLAVSDHLRRQVESSRIEIHAGRRVTKVLGDSEVQAVLLDNGEKLETSGLFIELGAQGAIELASGLGVALDTRRCGSLPRTENRRPIFRGSMPPARYAAPRGRWPRRLAKVVLPDLRRQLMPAASRRRLTPEWKSVLKNRCWPPNCIGIAATLSPSGPA